MLLIDEQVEEKLAAALELLRTDPKMGRCIALHLGAPLSSELKEMLFAKAQSHLAGIDAQIYMGNDGDVVVLAPTLPTKDGNGFLLAIGEHLNRPVENSWATFTDVALCASKLLVIVEEKLEKQRKIDDAKRKLIEQQQAERKRQAILNQTTMADANTINTRRTKRELPELMMIEDDVFSSKLVENVLQKKYAITSLKEANHALDTYARIAPDLLFLDINLPDVTGHEMLERILAIDPDAYVVMLSGNADQKNITQAMSKGAKGFIAKPFTREKLFQYLDRCPSIVAKQRVVAHS
jgi:two-component system chemotaxis response regulator CheY